MPFAQVDPTPCSRCKQVKSEFYVRPSDGKIGDTFCADCSREKRAARSSSARAVLEATDRFNAVKAAAAVSRPE